MSFDEKHWNSESQSDDLALSRSKHFETEPLFGGEQNGKSENPEGHTKSPLTSVAIQKTDCIPSSSSSHHDGIVNKKNLRSPKPWQYLCDICGRLYTHSSYFFQHLQFHRETKPFSCTEPYCNKRFITLPDVNQHVRDCHSSSVDALHECLACGMRFISASMYRQHRVMHRRKRIRGPHHALKNRKIRRRYSTPTHQLRRIRSYKIMMCLALLLIFNNP